MTKVEQRRLGRSQGEGTLSDPLAKEKGHVILQFQSEEEDFPSRRTRSQES